MKLILAILAALTLVAIPFTSEASSTIALNVALSTEFDYAQSQAVDIDGFCSIPPGDTSYVVYNMNMYIDPAKIGPYIALGLYCTKDGIQGYFFDSSATGFVPGPSTSPAFMGHGALQPIQGIGGSITNRVMLLTEYFSNLNGGSWTFQIQGPTGYYYTVATMVTPVTASTGIGLQSSINYPQPLYTAPTWDGIWEHPQGWQASTFTYVDFARGTARFNFTNLADWAACPNLVGILPVGSKNTFIAGTENGWQLTAVCNGQVWP